MIQIYCAHPLTAPTREGIDENRRRAAKWAAWLWKQGFAVECSWIVMTGELEETPDLSRARAEIRLRTSSKVRRHGALRSAVSRAACCREAGAAKVIVDFTHLAHGRARRENQMAARSTDHTRRSREHRRLSTETRNKSGRMKVIAFLIIVFVVLYWLGIRKARGGFLARGGH